VPGLLGEQREHREPDVAAGATNAPAGAATWALAEAGAEPRTKARPEAWTETRPEAGAIETASRSPPAAWLSWPS